MCFFLTLFIFYINGPQCPRAAVYTINVCRPRLAIFIYFFFYFRLKKKTITYTKILLGKTTTTTRLRRRLIKISVQSGSVGWMWRAHTRGGTPGARTKTINKLRKKERKKTDGKKTRRKTGLNIFNDANENVEV